MLTRQIRITAFILALLVAGVCFAQSPAPAVPAGEFVTEKSWGLLIVKSDKQGKLQFSIEAVGDNGHGCSLEGAIKGNTAVLEADEPSKPCTVKFVPTKDGIQVSSVPEFSCNFYCGMRASFEGLYLRAPAACRVDAMDKTRVAARKQYDRKAYAEARLLLDTTLKDCQRFLGHVTEGWYRNDLAVTLHKLKDFPACREALQPLAADAARKDAQIREDYAPTDAEIYLPVVKAARTNLKLCAAPP